MNRAQLKVHEVKNNRIQRMLRINIFGVIRILISFHAIKYLKKIWLWAFDFLSICLHPKDYITQKQPDHGELIFLNESEIRSTSIFEVIHPIIIWQCWCICQVMFKYFYSLIIISEILTVDFAELKYEICVYLMLEMAFLDLPSHFQPQNWFFRLPQLNENREGKFI